VVHAKVANIPFMMDDLGLVTGSEASACLTALDDPKMI
jgi:hypothetical protein